MGTVEAIFLRPAARLPVRPVQRATAVVGQGLDGDHAGGGKRQVTILAREAWDDACRELGQDVEPAVRRANVLVSGVDLDPALSDADVQALRALLLEHHVLFFRDQALDPDALLGLARRFGEPDVHAFGRHLPGRPQVGLLDQVEPKRDGANRWHTDSTFLARPPLAALLLAVELPADHPVARQLWIRRSILARESFDDAKDRRPARPRPPTVPDHR